MSPRRCIAVMLTVFPAMLGVTVRTQSTIGREVSIPVHLVDGQEFATSLPDLIEHGRRLFTAAWTSQEGGGRPQTKGTGAPLSQSPGVVRRSERRSDRQDTSGSPSPAGQRRLVGAGVHRPQIARYHQRGGRPERRSARHAAARWLAGFLCWQSEVPDTEVVGHGT
jgi:hypothetical protein